MLTNWDSSDNDGVSVEQRRRLDGHISAVVLDEHLFFSGQL